MKRQNKWEPIYDAFGVVCGWVMLELLISKKTGILQGFYGIKAIIRITGYKK